MQYILCDIEGKNKQQLLKDKKRATAQMNCGSFDESGIIQLEIIERRQL